MYLILLLDLTLAVGLAVVAVVAVAARGRASGLARLLASLAVLGALLPGLVGFGGYEVEMTAANAAVAMVVADQREAVRTEAEHECSMNLWFGGGSSAICLVLSGGLAALAFTRRGPDAER